MTRGVLSDVTNRQAEAQARPEPGKLLKRSEICRQVGLATGRDGGVAHAEDAACGIYVDESPAPSTASPPSTASAAEVAPLVEEAEEEEKRIRELLEQLSDNIGSCADGLLDLWAEAGLRPNSDRLLALRNKFSSMGPPQLFDALMRPPTRPPPRPPTLSMADFADMREASLRPQGHSAVALDRMDAFRGDGEQNGIDLNLISQHMVREQAVDVAQTCHAVSEEQCPSSEAISLHIAPMKREQIVVWLLQVFHSAQMPDSVLYLAVCLFDRYCASRRESLPEDQMQMTVLATVSIAVKVMGGNLENNRQPPRLRGLLDYFSQQRCNMEEIFAMELQVLAVLHFDVCTPSPLDFLDFLAAPIAAADASQGTCPVRCVAKFLLQLSLFDASMHYEYPHVILTAAAVYVALWCTRADEARIAELLQDVALTCKLTADASDPQEGA